MALWSTPLQKGKRSTSACHFFKLGTSTFSLLKEGGVRVCGDAVLLDFWCGFAVIFILSCGNAVLQNQAVCGN